MTAIETFVQHDIVFAIEAPEEASLALAAAPDVAGPIRIGRRPLPWLEMDEDVLEPAGDGVMCVGRLGPPRLLGPDHR